MADEWKNRITTHNALVSLPVVTFTLVIIWFSENKITPTPTVEASAANPIGLLISNFVYDGSINFENIVTSCMFLLIVFLYLPKMLRTFSAFLLPFVAVAAGGIAELTVIYAGPSICSKYCSFYGMSGVSSAIIGFTVANFAISLAYIILQRTENITGKQKASANSTQFRSQIFLSLAFVIYLVLLLIFAGVIALPAAHNPSSSGTTVPPPPAIFTQTPPVALVHATSLAYGFLLAMSIFVVVNRRYHILFSPATVRQMT